ncbi:winged helix-turn-helix domain-containing protein [Fluviibacterium sp. DFM31]|uniref:Winged helix-turn-helix domain-containing protein n=1 Tax=Meridianimarinicoccus marinus TaxID=3231483 RepID=A0ABV3L7W8_9RHOB
MTSKTGNVGLGDMRFDPDRRVILGRDGQTVALRPQSLDVLSVLVAHAGELVSKDDLIAAVWKDLNVTDDSLAQCISDVRRAIGDDRRAILQTVPKKGYRLVASAERTVSGAPARPLGRLMIGALAAIAILVLGIWQFRPAPIQSSPLFQTLVAPQVTRTEPSIAVLPFESIEDSARWTRLGRGLAADIASELALNEWLYVTVPESLMNVAFGAIPDGPTLDIQFALWGTIQAQGDEIRISAHLTDTATREIRWSESWTAPQEDIFAVQDRIVARIGASLASAYSGAIAQAGLRQARRKLTTNLDAYEHYLIGFEQLHRFKLEELPDTIAHLAKAVEFDPEFSGALVTLSVAQIIQSDHAEGEEARRLFDASQEAAYRAYAIDPNNPNVLWNLARAYALDGQLEIAAATLRRAVRTAPNNADVLIISAGYSSLAGIAGDEALSWARRALDLNPLAPAWWYTDLGTAAFGAGDYQLALDSMRRAPSGSNSRWLITALANVYLGNLPEAQRAAARFRELAPHLSIEQFLGGSEAERPDFRDSFAAARTLGLPITRDDLLVANGSASAAAGDGHGQ